MAEKFRITYATMSADNEELQSAYDAAAERARAELGKNYPVVVNGEERWTDEKYDEPSPIDQDLIIGRFSQARVKAFVPGWARAAQIVPAKSRKKEIRRASAKELEWAILVPRRLRQEWRRKREK